MSFVYAVRSNFTRPDIEEKWHAWYSGPKLAEMVTHPHLSIRTSGAGAQLV